MVAEICDFLLHLVRKMKPGFLGRNSDLGSTLEPNTTRIIHTNPNPIASFDFKLWGWSLLSFVPWLAIKARDKPTTINRELRKRTLPRGVVGNDLGGTRLRFRPYVSKVPWHTGVRAFLSLLFPRYGHYCGPNWSSGKDGGSLVWDKRPIDWLDFCCYCHDIGYDTHDQAKLLKADLAFLECLEKPNMKTKGDAHIAYLYKTMCTAGRETSDSIWMAEQREMEKLMYAKILKTDLES